MTTDIGRHRWRNRTLLLLILLVTSAAYSRALWNDFTYDDRGFVMVPNNQAAPNHMVAEVQDVGTYFTSHYGHGVTPYGRGFRPVTVLSFALCNKLVGRGPTSQRGVSDFPPWLQHLVNILLHLLGVGLTYALIARFAGAGVPALLGAAVFGLHALRSDSVISIVGRAEVLGYVFGAGGALCYAQALLGTRRKILWLTGAAVLLFLGCCSKENAMAWLVFVPLYALTLDCARNPGQTIVAGIRRQLPTLVAILVPAALAIGLWLRLQLNLLHDIEIRPVQNPVYFADDVTRVFTGIMLVGYGLYKTILPLHLACDYGASVFQLVDSILDYRFWIAAVVLLAVLIGGLRSFHRHPLLFLGMACFLGFSFVTSNILVRVETIFAERVYYTPAVGLSFLVAWIAQRVVSERRIWVVLAVVAWCVTGGLLISQRCVAWQDNDTLFLTDVQGQPKSLSMHLNAGEYYHRQGEAHNWQGDWKQRWHNHVLTAHDLDREDPLPLMALGGYHIMFGEMDKAEPYVQAAKDSPKLVENQNGADVRRLLALIAEDRGDLKTAEQYLLQGVELWPHMAAPHLEYAEFLKRTNRPEDAEAKLREIVDRFPDCEPGWMLLVEVVRRRKDEAETQAMLETARAAHPKSPRIALTLGLIHHKAGRYRQAVELLEQAYRGRVEERGLRECRIPLAESLGEVGRRREALDVLAEALREPKLSIERRRQIQELVRKLGGPR